MDNIDSFNEQQPYPQRILNGLNSCKKHKDNIFN